MAEHRKRFFLLLIYAVAALPFVAYGAIQALQVNANSPIDWVPADFPAREKYDAFRQEFGAGDIVVLSWDGCTVDDPRLDRLVEILRTNDHFFDENQQWFFEDVHSGRELLAEMAAEQSGITPDEARRRLQGTMIGPDGMTTCVVVGFTPAGVDQRGTLIPLIQEAAFIACDVPAADQHLAGPVIDGLSVDRASQWSLETIAPLSSFVILVVAWVCLESFHAAIVVFGLSVFCQGVSLAMIHYCGDTMSALLIVMPPLIQVLAVAGGIHLVNYYFDAVTDLGEVEAVEHAFRMGWLPCILSAGTTAIGLASLMVSELVPVRQFGAYAGAGVMFTVFVLLFFIPGTLLLRRMRLPKRLQKLSAGAHAPVSGRGWDALARLLGRYHAIVSLSAVAAMILLGFQLPQINTSVTIETLFPPDSRILRDYAWIEQHVGDLVPIEVVVQFDDNNQFPFPERLEIVNRVKDGLAEIAGVTGTMSAVDWLPPEMLDAEDGPPLPVEIRQRQWQAATEKLSATRYLNAGEEGRQSWRITARISALSKTDYTAFLELVEEHLAPLLNDDEQRPLSDVALLQTGIMPLVHHIQRQLLHDLFASFLTAFGVIAVVMTIVQAGVINGLVSMIPNVFPTLLLFGILGWLKAPIDIGSVMTASVALGIAVDDTLHYLTFFRRGLTRYGSPGEAVSFAYRHCGAAMIQTTVTCGAGLVLFAASDFVPTARFAWMMVGLLIAALFGDLILLPSLLLGPAGRLFQPPQQSQPLPADEQITVSATEANEQRTDDAEVVEPAARPSLQSSAFLSSLDERYPA